MGVPTAYGRYSALCSSGQVGSTVGVIHHSTPLTAAGRPAFGRSCGLRVGSCPPFNAAYGRYSAHCSGGQPGPGERSQGCPTCNGHVQPCRYRILHMRPWQVKATSASYQKWILGPRLVVLTAIVLASATAQADGGIPEYSILPLPTLGGTVGNAQAINNSNQIVGMAEDEMGRLRPARWDVNEGGAASVTDLGSLGSGSSMANDINARSAE